MADRMEIERKLPGRKVLLGAGAQEEFEMAMEHLAPAFGDTLVDMSCGSGIFSRRFATSRQFSGIIAADYSETMLQQTQQTFNDEGFPIDG